MTEAICRIWFDTAQVTRPEIFETWYIFLREASAQAVREVPRRTIEIPFTAWMADPLVPERLPH